MLMKMRSRMQNQKGFTLVELMVVVVILGILVAIAVPIYNNVTLRAEQAAYDATERTIQGAASTAYATDPDLSAGFTWTSANQGDAAQYLDGGMPTGWSVTVTDTGGITVTGPGRPS